MAPHRFLVVTCENAEKWSDYFDVVKATLGTTTEYKEQLQRGIAAPEEWREYRAWLDELPSDEELAQATAVIIPGSHLCANDPFPWLEGVRQLIRRIVARGAPQLYGSCFGSQIIAASLGGRVEKSPKMFRFDVEPITIFPAFERALPHANGLMDIESPVHLLESHGDVVTALPPNAVWIGTSEYAPYEVYAIGDQVLAMQAHPEFWPELIIDKISPCLERKGILTAAQLEQCARNMRSAQLDSQKVCNIIKNFLLRAFDQQQAPRSCSDQPQAVPAAACSFASASTHTVDDDTASPALKLAATGIAHEPHTTPDDDRGSLTAVPSAPRDEPVDMKAPPIQSREGLLMPDCVVLQAQAPRVPV